MRQVVLVVALGAVLAGMATAAGWCAVAAPPKLGVVDMDRVAAEYGQMADLNQQFQDFQRDQEQQLSERHKTRMLTDAERQDFVDLSHMAAPTENRDKRLAELEALSNQREKRLMELRKKEAPTAEEAAELKELTARYEARMADLATLQAQLQESRVTKYQELSKLIGDRVNDAVKTVAEDQKLAMVLRKESVMFGGVDITEAVIAKLNAKPAA